MNMTNLVTFNKMEVYRLLDKFEKLDAEKRLNILRSALNVFADKGYQDASTNKIVEGADISKGTLFYYFKNKEGLYYYLIDYSLEIIKNEYINHIDHTTLDIIKRMENNSKIKYQYFQKYPEVNYFLSTVLYSELEHLSVNYQEKFQDLIQTSVKKMKNQQNIQENLFKENIKPEKAARIIELSIEGYFSELANTFKQHQVKDIDFDTLWEEFDEYLDTLREIFYKSFEEE